MTCCGLDLLGVDTSPLLWVVAARGVERARDSKRGESGEPVKSVAIARKDGTFSRWADEGNDQLSAGEGPYRGLIPPPTPPGAPAAPAAKELRRGRGALSVASFLGGVVGIGTGAYLWSGHRVLGGILGYFIGFPVGGAAGILLGLEE